MAAGAALWEAGLVALKYQEAQGPLAALRHSFQEPRHRLVALAAWEAWAHYCSRYCSSDRLAACRARQEEPRQRRNP